MNNAPIRPPVAPLFVPGHRPERFTKAAASDADAIIIDLEDAVHDNDKPAAQNNLRVHGIRHKPVFVRINARQTACWRRDLDALADAKVDGVMVPKAETAEDIVALHTTLGRELPVIALVESAAGFANLRSLLRAPLVLCAAFGSLDYTLDLNCEPSWEALLHARSLLALECRIAGLPAPIDGVTPQFNDDDLLRKETLRARSLGYRGKLAIHPRQTAIIRESMLPTAEEFEWAKKIIAAAEYNPGAAQVDGTMIDNPVIQRAQQIIQSMKVSRG